MKKSAVSTLFKCFGVLTSLALLAFNYSEPMRMLRNLSEDLHIRSGENYSIPLSQSGLFTASSADSSLAVSVRRDQSLADVMGEVTEEPANITIRLLGVIPVKQVSVHVRDEITLMPGGNSIGVTLHTRGAMVVGISSVVLSNGEQISPAAAAGIQAGDVIEKINGMQIKDASHLAQLCNESTNSIEVSVLRGNERLEVTLHPVLDPSDNQLRMGMWVRDSTAGVGTLSFYDSVSQWYAALGHAITDVDTRAPLTVRDGEIVQSVVVDIVQGAQGEPGELRGTFDSTSLPLGTIELNSQYGIYGRMYQQLYNPLFPEGIQMAYPEEARLGPAKLLTTLNENGIQAYDCNIIKLNPQSSSAQKGMVVEITDLDLLNATGGIVQGMSGSPVIQNDKLIGVVTHVFINDPTKGYCMYTQWMYEQIA